MIRPSVKSVREWSDTFDYYENWLNSGKEIFEFFKQIHLRKTKTGYSSQY